MNIDKAIKNLTAGREDFYMIPPHEYTPTIDLAIEALELILAYRKWLDTNLCCGLPGETKE